MIQLNQHHPQVQSPKMEGYLFKKGDYQRHPEFYLDKYRSIPTLKYLRKP